MSPGRRWPSPAENPSSKTNRWPPPSPNRRDLAGAPDLTLARAVKSSLGYDSLQNTLNLRRVKRFGNKRARRADQKAAVLAASPKQKQTAHACVRESVQPQRSWHAQARRITAGPIPAKHTRIEPISLLGKPVSRSGTQTFRALAFSEAPLSLKRRQPEIHTYISGAPPITALLRLNLL
jgi:hypothetical protein